MFVPLWQPASGIFCMPVLILRRINMMMMMIYVAVCADPTQQVGSSCQRADQYITRPMRATRACSCRPTLRVDIYFVRRSRPAHNNNRLPLAWRGGLSASITRPSRRLISTVPPPPRADRVRRHYPCRVRYRQLSSTYGIAGRLAGPPPRTVYVRHSTRPNAHHPSPPKYTVASDNPT